MLASTLRINRKWEAMANVNILKALCERGLNLRDAY